jgi:hypothetical protein
VPADASGLVAAGGDAGGGAPSVWARAIAGRSTRPAAQRLARIRMEHSERVVPKCRRATGPLVPAAKIIFL